jgi:mono/diheme cytochrome c family protein
VFTRECEQCHGKAGHGDGPQAMSLKPRPADLASARVQSQTDGALFWKISEGRGMMPKAAFGESDKWAVIDYLRTLAAPK